MPCTVSTIRIDAAQAECASVVIVACVENMLQTLRFAWVAVAELGHFYPDTVWQQAASRQTQRDRDAVLYCALLLSLLKSCVAVFDNYIKVVARSCFTNIVLVIALLGPPINRRPCQELRERIARIPAEGPGRQQGWPVPTAACVCDAQAPSSDAAPALHPFSRLF